MDSTTLTASLDTSDNLILEAIVPKNTWFGLGFGKNNTLKMAEADIIFFRNVENNPE